MSLLLALASKTASLAAPADPTPARPSNMKRLVFAVLALCLSAGIAHATTCTVSATPVGFGTFNPFGSAVPSTGIISVTCSSGNPNGTYTIALSTGGSGNFATRQMTDGQSDMLNYNLYTSSALTTIWGDGTSGTVTVGGTNGHTTSTFTVYGQIPTPQAAKPNAYSDSIIVTVTY
jgi:spore coat protein U-like protein